MPTSRDEYLRSIRLRSPETQRRVDQVIRTFEQSEIPPDELVLERFFLWRCESVQTATAITDVVCLKSYLRFLKRRKILDIDLDAAAEHFREVRPRTPMVSPEIADGLEKLLTALRPKRLSGRLYRGWLRDRALLSLLWFSGLRRAEVAGLTREQVKTDAVRLIGKGGKERVIFIHPHTRERIDQYLEHRIDDNPRLLVQHSRRDEGGDISLNGIYTVVKLAGQAAGIEAHPHMLRHAYVRNMLKAGVSLTDVGDLVGHASPATTKMVYGRYDENDLHEKVKAAWGK